VAEACCDDQPKTWDEGRTGEQQRAELVRALRDAAELPCMGAGAVGWLLQKVADEKFNLVVAGQFKRGKSSVINALLGARLLPAGVIPLTSVVTVIRSGPTTRARIELLDGRSQELPLERLSDYVTERGNPQNTKGIRQVVIEHPAPWLADGVQLVDTPGIGSVYEHNTDVTQSYLPQADAVLLIASVEQPVSRAELDFLSSIRQYAPKSFCLLNKTDYLQPHELSESVTFAREAIHVAIGAVPVFAVSARLALESKLAPSASSASSGFPEFERALHRFMVVEKWAVWTASVTRALLRILAQARFTLDVEAKVLGMPLAQIEEKLAAFEAKKRELQRALVDYQVLMDSGTRTLMKEHIEPALEAFKRSEQEHIGVLVKKWFEELRSLPAQKLDVELEGRTAKEIRAAYDGWLSREDSATSAAFQALCGRFWAEMQSSVAQLMRYSSELFAVTFEHAPDNARWTPDSSFYYKFWYEPSGLATLSSSLVSVLPKSLSARLILRRRTTQALELVEVQAGRLRYDFEQRLQQSTQDARTRMVKRIEATLVAIGAAIENGLAARRHGAGEMAASMTRITRARESIASIESRVKAIDSPQQGETDLGVTSLSMRA
jgi:GTP-binding protein EngB required for normal cell division